MTATEEPFEVTAGVSMWRCRGAAAKSPAARTLAPATIAGMATPSSQHEQIREKWAGWLDRVKKDVLTLSLERVLWKEVMTAIQEHAAETSATFRDHYTRLYVHTQAAAIRRLMLHRNADYRSLSSLIVDFVRHPDVWTRAQYAAAHVDNSGDDYWLKIAPSRFDELFGDGGDGADAENLSVAKLTADLDRIKAVCEKVTDYADNEIAHVGRPVASVTFGELDAAIDVAEEMFTRYALLLTASTWVLPPVVQGNWHSTFDRPLFPRHV